MSVSYVSSSIFTKGSESTIGRLLIPSSTLSGHDLYVLVGSDGHTTSVAYPTVTDNDSGGNVFALQGEVPARKGLLFWKKATSASASKLVTVAGMVDVGVGGLSVYSGALETGNPTTDVAGETNNAGSPSHTSFIPDYANSMICLGVFNYFSNGSVDAMACTNPGTLEPERFQYRNQAAGQAMVIHGSSLQLSALGNTGTFTWTQSVETSRSIAWAIRPGTPPSQVSLGSGTTISPVHTYASSGTYVIRLRVTDNLGASSTSTQSVFVS